MSAKTSFVVQWGKRHPLAPREEVADMNSSVRVSLRFKDVEHDETLNQILEDHCRRIADEFHETNHLELTLSLEAGEVSAHAHVAGKQTQVAAHAQAPDTRQAGDLALQRLERELRRHHDKRIFSARRAAQRDRNRHPAAGGSTQD